MGDRLLQLLIHGLFGFEWSTPDQITHTSMEGLSIHKCTISVILIKLSKTSLFYLGSCNLILLSSYIVQCSVVVTANVCCL